MLRPDRKIADTVIARITPPVSLTPASACTGPRSGRTHCRRVFCLLGYLVQGTTWGHIGGQSMQLLHG
jgi:hypothetical protein